MMATKPKRARRVDSFMLRNLFTIGLITLLGLVALKLVFGLLGPLVGLLIFLLTSALKIAVVGAVVYGVIRIVSPETARRITDGLRR
jgi:hypothetical protein